MRLNIHRRFVLGLLMATVATVSVLGAAAQFAHRHVHHSHLSRVTNLFRLDTEYNLASWYSSLALMLCALVLALIAEARRRAGHEHARRWWGLAIIFFVLSLDEAMGLHELLNTVLQPLRGLSSMLYFPWVLPELAFAVVVFLIYWPLLRTLRQSIRIRILLAGCVYVFGAAGMEMISGWVLTRHSNLIIWYDAAASIEEILEMLGVLLFFDAITEYLVETISRVDIRLIGKPRRRRVRIPSAPIRPISRIGPGPPAPGIH